MFALIPSVQADAEALFTHTLQPVLDTAARAESSGPGIGWMVGGAVVIGLVGLVGCSLWQDRPPRDARADRPPSIPFSPVPMTRFFLLLVAVLLATPAFAQTHADPMAALTPFEGTYTLDGTPHEAPGGSFDGTLTIAPTLGGHFQQWDWDMTMRGEGVNESVHLRFVVGYDAATRTYTIHRFDSRDASSPTRSAGAFDSSKGRLQVDGNSLVMAWAMMNANDAPRNGTFRNRVRVTDSGLLIETEGAPDDGSPVVAVATTRAARR